MDKKKVKEHIQRALVWIDTMTTESANYETAIKMAAKNLEFAMDELSKSDWVSVKDGLPPYEEEVLVTSNVIPDDVRLLYRTKLKHPSKDKNDFYCPNHYIVTHWKPIEKMEE